MNTNRTVSRSILGRLSGFSLAVLLNGLISLVSIPLVIATAGASYWSAVAIGQSIGTLGAVVAGWGWATTGPAEVAAMNAVAQRRYFVESIRVRLTLLIPTIACATPVALWLGRASPSDAAVMAIGCTLSGVSASWYFIGTGKPLQLMLWDTFPRAIGTLLGVLLITIGFPLICYPISFTAVTLVGLIFANIRIYRDYKIDRLSRHPSDQVSAPPRRSTILKQWPIVTASLLASIYLTLPLTFVAALSPRDIEVYALADRMMRLAITATSPIAQLAQGWVPAGDPIRLNSRILKATWAASVVATVVGATFAFGGPLLGRGLSTGSVQVSLGLTAPLSIALACSILTQTIGLACLVALGRQRIFVIAAWTGAAIGTPLLFVLTNFAGGSGAAWSVASAEIGVLILELGYLFQSLHRAKSASS